MSFFSGLDFFITLIIAIIPAIVIGLNGKSLRYYRGFLTCIFIYLIYRNSLMELAFLIGYSAMSLGLVKLYLLSRIKMGRNKFFYASAVIITLCPLILSKLESFVGHGFFGSGSTIFGFLGLSYIFFRVIQTIIEIYDGIINEITLSSGPIDRSRRFSQDCYKIYTGKEYSELLSNGIVKIMWGLLYKLPLSGTAMYIMNTYMINKYDPIHIIGYAYSYGLYMFFDFAGYSLMAVGTGYILGIKVPDNFNKPFISIDIKDFWDRWHITLSHWFRDFIFSRFLFNSLSKKRFKGKLTAASAGLMINMTLMGIWHGLELHYIAYGVYHGILLVIAELYQKKSRFYKLHKRDKVYKIVSWFITLNLVMFGFLIFSGQGRTAAIGLLEYLR